MYSNYVPTFITQTISYHRICVKIVIQKCSYSKSTVEAGADHKVRPGVSKKKVGFGRLKFRNSVLPAPVPF